MTSRALLATLSIVCVAGGACTHPAVTGVNTGATVAVVRKAARDQLVPFASKDELTKFLKDLAEAQRKEVEAQAKAAADSDGVMTAGAPPPAEAAPASPAPAASAAASTSDNSITNTQHAGVDEGDIVKVHGDHLVVLRRGRLFTIDVGSGGKALEPISAVDAYGPGINPGGTWYDEMLVSTDTVVVIGYSYERGGTEVGLFDIDAAGHLRYRSTYQLRSNDYYSSRNYASRLIGSKLIFYSPLYLELGGADPFHSFPAVRHWHPGATDAEFVSIVEPTRVYRPIEPASSLALHTVTTCDLAAPTGMQCSARAVMGPPGRVFYVSPDSVYVWMSPWEAPDAQQKERARSLVYRLPLDGGEPSVVRVRGTPTDQFSFDQTGDGYLNVLVRAEAAGDAMWAPEVTSGDIALLRMPLGLFSRAADEAPASEYTKLPKPDGYTLENRFVGDYVLYGTGESWGYGQPKLDSRLYAYRWAGGQAPVEVRLGHGVDRIEAMGRNAVVVGGDGKDLHFSTIALGGARPALAGRYVRQGAAQGETRSHGFFYKPEGDRAGFVGLPIRSEGSPGYAQLAEGSASVLFLRNDDLQLREIGALGAHPGVGRNDACRASCVDWYGNARPIFLRGRILALLGYELVEGEMDGARLFETRRVSFAPGAQRPVRAQ